ncbi:hypothetical protein COCNU_scaffold004112G000080 [Cocos nucifera]|nr:hypothetical protein [Cocos nucifera]
MDEKLQSPIGFEIIFPGMLGYAIEMGLDLPISQNDIDFMFHIRDLELQRWDGSHEKEFCSEQVKIVYSAFYSTINELGAKASALQKHSVTGHLVERWLTLMRAMMKETEWARTKAVPTVDEYMANGYISFALGPIILPTLYFLGPELSVDAIGDPEYHNLYKLVSICGRLLNDVRSFEREDKEGNWNSVSLRIVHGCGSTSKEEAVREIQSIIDSSREELMRLVLQNEGSVVPRACKEQFWKISRMLHFFYKKNDGFTSPKEMVSAMNAVIYEPLKVEMDTQAIEMLTNGLYTKKRKGKAPSDSSKRAKVDASSSAVPTSTVTTFEVIASTKAALTIKVGTTGMSSVPPMPSGPSSGDQTLELPIKGEIGEGREKKKAIAKASRKAHLSRPDGDSDERGEDPFDNLEIVRDLTNRFAMPEVVDQMADLDLWWLIWGSLGTILKITRCLPILRGRIVRRRRHRRPRRTFEPRSIIFKRGLPRLKAALALEERKKEVENRVIELETQMTKLISEVMTQTVKEFKTSPEMRNLNVKFGQEAFIKNFEIYKGRMARRFFELDLSFLKEGDVDAGPSDAVVDSSFDELASGPSKPATEAFESVRKSEVAESAPTPSSTIPPESSINTDLLPQGVPMKPLIKSLRGKIHLLKKKLKKMEDDLRTSRKNASKATREITCLHGLHMKDAVSFSIRKGSFEKEIIKLKRNASDKSWALTAKNLKKAKKKIYLLEGSSSWSTNKARYDWDWSQRLEGELKTAKDEAAYLQKRLHSSRKASTSGESEDIASLKRTIGELSKAVGVEKAEV